MTRCTASGLDDTSGRIMSEAARWWNTARPLTHPLATTREGLAMKATQRVCAVQDCTKLIQGARSAVCIMHQTRMKRHGNYQGIRAQAPAAERFERYVERQSDGGCWLWTGMKNNNGYGRFFVGEAPGASRSSGQMYAHRWSYQHHVGPIGDLHILHVCDTPACVNPAHMRLGTPAQNAADKAAKGRSKRAACAKGHEWTPENTHTFLNAKGQVTRRCTLCRRAKRLHR